jgi:hypothetical protein
LLTDLAWRLSLLCILDDLSRQFWLNTEMALVALTRTRPESSSKSAKTAGAVQETWAGPTSDSCTPASAAVVIARRN